MLILDRVESFSHKYSERQLLNDGFYSNFEGKKAIQFASLLPNYQSKKSTSQKVVLEGEEYDVGINFYNMGACDLNKVVIICIGSEILDSNPAFEDNIVGWALAEDGSMVEILVSEDFAESTDHPLFIVANGVDENIIEGANQNLENSSKTSLKGATSTIKYELKLDEEKITERYENSGDSEYNVSWIIEYYGSNGYTGSSGMLDNTSKHIKDIKKTQIGDLLDYETKFSWYVPGVANTYQFLSTDRILFTGVTYEHDWYASLKTKSIDTGFHIASIKFRSTSSSHYYQPFSFDIGSGGSYGWYGFDQTVYSKGLAKFESIRRVY